MAPNHQHKFNCNIDRAILAIILQSGLFSSLLGLGLVLSSQAIANPVENSPELTSELTSLGIATKPELLNLEGNNDRRLLIAEAEKDVVDTAIAVGDFTVLVQALADLGMDEDLRGFGRFTLFAPTDDAFKQIPTDILQVLAADPDLMSKVLSYHVVVDTKPLTAEVLERSESRRTLQRGNVELRRRRKDIYINDVKVIKSFAATNGVIHAIDQVLIPDDLMVEIRRQ